MMTQKNYRDFAEVVSVSAVSGDSELLSSVGCEQTQKERFLAAVERILREEKSRQGIGRLSEKTLHAVIKDYIEPDRSFHEVKVGSRVADIKRDDRIFEIQSAGFHLLRDKLDEFLPESKVTVVYPLAATKYIIKVSSDGELSKPRKSPRSMALLTVFTELYKIRQYLSFANLSLRVIGVDMNEYRLLRSPGQKRKGKFSSDSVRLERMPTALAYDETFSCPRDYLRLLGAAPPDAFTVKELASFSGVRGRHAYFAVNVLLSLGILERCPNRGREYVYRIVSPTA